MYVGGWVDVRSEAKCMHWQGQDLRGWEEHGEVAGHKPLSSSDDIWGWWSAEFRVNLGESLNFLSFYTPLRRACTRWSLRFFWVYTYMRVFLAHST